MVGLHPSEPWTWVVVRLASLAIESFNLYPKTLTILLSSSLSTLVVVLLWWWWCRSRPPNGKRSSSRGTHITLIRRGLGGVEGQRLITYSHRGGARGETCVPKYMERTSNLSTRPGNSRGRLANFRGGGPSPVACGLYLGTEDWYFQFGEDARISRSSTSSPPNSHVSQDEEENLRPNRWTLVDISYPYFWALFLKRPSAGLIKLRLWCTTATSIRVLGDRLKSLRKYHVSFDNLWT